MSSTSRRQAHSGASTSYCFSARSPVCGSKRQILRATSTWVLSARLQIALAGDLVRGRQRDGRLRPEPGVVEGQLVVDRRVGIALGDRVVEGHPANAVVAVDPDVRGKGAVLRKGDDPVGNVLGSRLAGAR